MRGRRVDLTSCITSAPTGLGRVSRARVQSVIFLKRTMMYSKDDYEIYDERNMVQLDKVESLLKKSYWANERDIETIKISIENSVCFSLFHDKEQVGFARVVTDYASVAYIADVIIDPKHRGKGVGKWLIETMIKDGKINSNFL